jgi:hypothetical protein
LLLTPARQLGHANFRLDECRFARDSGELKRFNSVRRMEFRNVRGRSDQKKGSRFSGSLFVHSEELGRHPERT